MTIGFKPFETLFKIKLNNASTHSLLFSFLPSFLPPSLPHATWLLSFSRSFSNCKRKFSKCSLLSLSWRASTSWEGNCLLQSRQTAAAAVLALVEGAVAETDGVASKEQKELSKCLSSKRCYIPFTAAAAEEDPEAMEEEEEEEEERPGADMGGGGGWCGVVTDPTSSLRPVSRSIA